MAAIIYTMTSIAASKVKTRAVSRNSDYGGAILAVGYQTFWRYQLTDPFNAKAATNAAAFAN